MRGGAGAPASPGLRAAPEAVCAGRGPTRTRVSVVVPCTITPLPISRAPSPCVIAICALAHGAASRDPGVERVPASSGCHKLREVTWLGWRGHAGGPRVCMWHVRSCGHRCFLAGGRYMAPLSWLLKCHCRRGGLCRSAFSFCKAPLFPRRQLNPRAHPLPALGTGQGSTSPCPVGSWAAGRPGPGPGSAGPPGPLAGPAPSTACAERPFSQS